MGRDQRRGELSCKSWWLGQMYSHCGTGLRGYRHSELLASPPQVPPWLPTHQSTTVLFVGSTVNSIDTRGLQEASVGLHRVHNEMCDHQFPPWLWWWDTMGSTRAVRTGGAVVEHLGSTVADGRQHVSMACVNANGRPGAHHGLVRDHSAGH